MIEVESSTPCSLRRAHVCLVSTTIPTLTFVVNHQRVEKETLMHGLKGNPRLLPASGQGFPAQLPPEVFLQRPVQPSKQTAVCNYLPMYTATHVLEIIGLSYDYARWCSHLQFAFAIPLTMIIYDISTKNHSSATSKPRSAGHGLPHPAHGSSRLQLRVRQGRWYRWTSAGSVGFS